MYKWLLVVILWVVGLLNYADRQVIFSVFPPIGRELGASGAQLGLLGTAFLWVYGLISPFGGYAADRFGRRRVLVASLAVWSAVTFWTGHVHSYGELLAARALMGISEAFYLPAALAMIADYHDDSTRARAVGLHQSGLYAGVLLGGAGGGWFASHFGWRAAFVALGAAGIVYGLVLWPALRDLRGRRSAATGWASLAAIESRPFLIVAGANALTSIAYWCVYTWLPVYLYEDFKMSLAQAGFAATFYIQIASFAGILAGGWLSDRWSRSNRRARLFVQSIGMAAAGPLPVHRRFHGRSLGAGGWSRLFWARPRFVRLQPHAHHVPGGAPETPRHGLRGFELHFLRRRRTDGGRRRVPQGHGRTRSRSPILRRHAAGFRRAPAAGQIARARARNSRTRAVSTGFPVTASRLRDVPAITPSATISRAATLETSAPLPTNTG